MNIVGLFKQRRIKGSKGVVLLEKRASVDKKCLLEGGNRIKSKSSLKNTYLGFATYIGNNSHLYNCMVGRYCSIGSRVMIIRGSHPLHFVSTHPAFYSKAKQCGFTYVNEQKYVELTEPKYFEKYSVKIGNDVWIGSDVRILDGVEIGDGAVVATGAVVTKDVPPYAIVGGVDSKLIKYRFDEDAIRKLLIIKWWEKDEQWIKNNKELFVNIDVFLKQNECFE